MSAPVALTPVQVRILGCLIEKERTTPDAYPLTINGLLTACNQTTNRFPVVRLDERTVGNALENLRGLNLVRIVYSRSNRAEKWRQVMDEAMLLSPAETALLCVLMLRGPQTGSELRARTERLFAFADQESVDTVLRDLASRPEPVVALMERRPGQKENRWAQLIGAELPADDQVAPSITTPSGGGSLPGAGDRMSALEATVDDLRTELATLRADFDRLADELR